MKIVSFVKSLKGGIELLIHCAGQGRGMIGQWNIHILAQFRRFLQEILFRNARSDGETVENEKYKNKEVLYCNIPFHAQMLLLKTPKIKKNPGFSNNRDIEFPESRIY